MSQVVRALEARADADSLAAAAVLLADGVNHRRSLDLVARAVAAEPTRPDLVWLQIQSCVEVTDCDPAPLEARFRTLDPSNAAGWLGPLLRASRSGDESARDEALRALGQSDRFDVYLTTLVARLSGAVARTKKLSVAESVLGIMGHLTGRLFLGQSAVSRACKGDELKRPGRVVTCQGIVRSLERGDTTLTESLGIAIAQRVWPEQSPEWQAASAARWTHEYRSRLWSKLVTDPPTERDAARYLQLCSEKRREQDVLLARLLDAGMQPDPPGP